MSTHLGARSARGGGALVSGQALRLVLQLSGVVLLSRLLSPADFGLIAMVTVFVALGDLLRDAGVPTAALQARELSRQQSSNAFWVNTTLGLIAAALVTACTPLMSAVYEEPRLWSITPVMAIALVLNGLQAQVQVILAREMRYATIAITDTVSQAFALALALVAAWAGLGYWALVIQAVAAPLALLVSRFSIVRWVPSRPRRGHASMELLKQGAHYGVAHLLTFAASNAATLTIGIRFGAEATGLYNRAFQLLLMPISSVLTPLTQVVVPATRESGAGDPRAWQRVLLRAQFIVAGGCVALFAILASVAAPLIPLVLGDQWTGTVILFQLLALGGCFQVLSYVSYWAFIVNDLSRPLAQYNLVTKPLTIGLILIGSLIGPAGVAAGYALGLAVSWPLNLLWLRRFAGLDATQFGAQGLMLLLGGAAGFGAGYTVVALTSAMPALLSVLLGSAAAGAIFALSLAVSSHGRKGTAGAWALLRGAVGRR